MAVAMVVLVSVVVLARAALVAAVLVAVTVFVRLPLLAATMVVAVVAVVAAAVVVAGSPWGRRLVSRVAGRMCATQLARLRVGASRRAALFAGQLVLAAHLLRGGRRNGGFRVVCACAELAPAVRGWLLLDGRRGRRLELSLAKRRRVGPSR